MVDERFGFARALGHAEYVGQELFDEEEVRGGCEGGVEGEDRTGAAEAVAGKVEFGSCVDCFRRGVSIVLGGETKEGRFSEECGRTVLEMAFYGWAVGGFAHPDVEVFALAGFEEEDVVAVVEVGELVQLVELCFGVEFCVFAAVREEGVEVV